MTNPLILATGAGWAPTTKAVVAAGLALWLAVAWALGVSGVLAADASQTLRPVLLPIVVPVAAFLGAYAGSVRFRGFVLSWDIRVLTMLHHWRVLGFTFLMLYAHGVLPGLFAGPAGLGDVAIGLSAPLVVQALARHPGFARSRAFVTFHVLGMFDFIVAGAAATLASGAFPSLHSGPLTSAPMEVWPLSVFPGFVVPSFLSLHMGVLFQVRALRRQEARAS